MSSKLNRILGLLLVAQIAVLLATRLSTSSSGPVKPTELFPKLDTESISEISVVDDEGKQAILAREGDQWLLRSGADYPTKKDSVSEFLAKLPALKAGSTVTDKRSHHRALEVSKEKFSRKITLSQKKGNKRTFYLGSSPGIKQVHFRFEGQEQVYLASELSAWDIGTSASSWIDTTYFKIEQAEAVALRLRNEHGTIELSKGESGEWTLSGLPKGKTLDTTQVDTLLSSVSSIAMQTPVARSVQPSHGLEQPKASLTLVTQPKPSDNKGTGQTDGAGTTAEGATPPAAKATPGDAKANLTKQAVKPDPKPSQLQHTLTIGVKQGEDYYAKASDSEFVVLVGSWAAEPLLKKKALDLFEKPKDEQPTSAEDDLP